MLYIVHLIFSVVYFPQVCYKLYEGNNFISLWLMHPWHLEQYLALNRCSEKKCEQTNWIHQISITRITLILNVWMKKHYQANKSLQKFIKSVSFSYIFETKKILDFILYEESGYCSALSGNEHNPFGSGSLKDPSISEIYLVSIQNGTWSGKAALTIRFVPLSPCNLPFSGLGFLSWTNPGSGVVCTCAEIFVYQMSCCILKPDHWMLEEKKYPL